MQWLKRYGQLRYCNACFRYPSPVQLSSAICDPFPSRQFHLCLLPLPTRFVKGKNSVSGPVADYWNRFEEQGRSSLHHHLLLWMKNVDDPPSLTMASEVDVDENGDPIEK